MALYQCELVHPCHAPIERTMVRREIPVVTALSPPCTFMTPDQGEITRRVFIGYRITYTNGTTVFRSVRNRQWTVTKVLAGIEHKSASMNTAQFRERFRVGMADECLEAIQGFQRFS